MYSGHETKRKESSSRQLFPLFPNAGPPIRLLGMLPNPAQLPLLPTFVLAPSSSSGLDLLAAAAAGEMLTHSKQPTLPILPILPANSYAAGPYNPAAVLLPKLVKQILALEFIEMSELRVDIWPDDTSPQEGTSQSHHQPAKPPVNDIRIWLECYACMATVLATWFLKKALELWAYQTTIIKAAHTYEGSNWVSYDRQFRREMLTRKDLDWSVSNARLYNEAFTGRARSIPHWPHCLSEDHTAAVCQFNPNPPIVGWLQDPRQFLNPSVPQAQPQGLGIGVAAAPREVFHNYNSEQCFFALCRFAHTCSECQGRHPATRCPLSSANRARGRGHGRGRVPTGHPYRP